uniref:Uncharacterized protein n=1 Tax=Solanum tuberosum TaxID=4113 RepID=M1DAQ8_SOLTU
MVSLCGNFRARDCLTVVVGSSKNMEMGSFGQLVRFSSSLELETPHRSHERLSKAVGFRRKRRGVFGGYFGWLFGGVGSEKKGKMGGGLCDISGEGGGDLVVEERGGSGEYDRKIS